MSFNAARNKVVRLIGKAKKEAIINEIDNSKLNSRVTKVKQMSRINSLTKDQTSYSTPEEIFHIFNEHLISIADNIIDNPVNTEPDLTSLVDFVIRKKTGNSADFSIPTISEREVLEIIKSLPSNVATGLDGISSPLLKLIAPAVAPSLAKEINCTIILHSSFLLRCSLANQLIEPGTRFSIAPETFWAQREISKSKPVE